MDEDQDRSDNDADTQAMRAMPGTNDQPAYAGKEEGADGDLTNLPVRRHAAPCTQYWT